MFYRRQSVGVSRTEVSKENQDCIASSLYAKVHQKWRFKMGIMEHMVIRIVQAFQISPIVCMACLGSL